MKNKVLTGICFVLLFMPWSILFLRQFPWALESPAAEIMIGSYALLMAAGGIFTAAVYGAGHLRGTMMKICLVVNSVYAVGGTGLLALMLLQKTS